MEKVSRPTDLTVRAWWQALRDAAKGFADRNLTDGAAALWSASGYVGAFTRASNAIYSVQEDRPIWKRRPLELLITVILVCVLTLVLLGLVVGGPVADAIGDELGIGETALQVWSIAKWPLLFGVVVLVLALLYRVAPNASHMGLRWILPGSLLATLLWIVASAGFSSYVSHFGSYSNTYGGLAAVVVFLIWLWLTNVAVLFGAQFAAELERTGRAAAHATPPGGFAPFVTPAHDEPGEETERPVVT